MNRHQKNNSVRIEKVSVDHLNIADFINKMDESGVYEITNNKSAFVVFVGSGISADDINAKVIGNDIEINYFKKTASDDNLSICDSALYISNVDKIQYVRLYLNGMEKSFKKVFATDEPLVVNNSTIE